MPLDSNSKKDQPHEAFSPLMELNASLFKQRRIRLLVKRDDLLHPHISGNKWRKLKYNLQAIQQQHKKGIITFGGAYSNHIAAVAAAGKKYNLPTVGIIRGEATASTNSTLSFAKMQGMNLHFVTRADYRLHVQSPVIQEIISSYPSYQLLPEGGTNQLALRGCAEIADEVRQQLSGTPTHYCLSCGTGGTMAGLLTGVAEQATVVGFSALKGDWMEKEIRSLLNRTNYEARTEKWRVEQAYHFGGYARWKPHLIDFIREFKLQFDIPLDPIYTGKLFYGVMDLIEKQYFPPEATIVVLHSGGLQGNAGFKERYGIVL